MVNEYSKSCYINGEWVAPEVGRTIEVINPATEQAVATIALGDKADVDKAVEAARKAFVSFGDTTVEQRLELLDRVLEVYKRRIEDLAVAVSTEMGAPISFARRLQAAMGVNHLTRARQALTSFEYVEEIGSTSVVREPIGVCGFITPWNWPLNQISAKVAAALAAGCTMVLKPSEIAPLSAIVFTEILDEAGVPAGVFNVVNGDGPTVGAALSSHPDIDLISFTGSTRAGIEVARNAASTIKRVTQELGGNSANIVLDDANFDEVIARDVAGVYTNAGQSCNASARILVPIDRLDEAADIAARTADGTRVGLPSDEETILGPLVSEQHFDKVQGLIEKGVAEGAKLVAGGPGKPEGLSTGYFVRPTVFTNVTNDMTIAQEEIFGPVVTLIGYRDEDEAVQIANDTAYGLSGAVSAADPERARAVARRLRTGMVHINGTQLDGVSPFGGYKQSGNGREFGSHGLNEYFETKSIFGDR